MFLCFKFEFIIAHVLLYASSTPYYFIKDRAINASNSAISAPLYLAAYNTTRTSNYIRTIIPHTLIPIAISISLTAINFDPFIHICHYVLDSCENQFYRQRSLLSLPSISGNTTCTIVPIPAQSPILLALVIASLAYAKPVYLTAI